MYGLTTAWIALSLAVVTVGSTLVPAGPNYCSTTKPVEPNTFYGCFNSDTRPKPDAGGLVDSMIYRDPRDPKSKSPSRRSHRTLFARAAHGLTSRALVLFLFTDFAVVLGSPGASAKFTTRYQHVTVTARGKNCIHYNIESRVNSDYQRGDWCPGTEWSFTIGI